ncbi:MAG: Peptidase M20 [Spirochaetes bacterium]|nr:MAG: Peptidase M20 [Spirochaetota bacterium]
MSKKMTSVQEFLRAEALFDLAERLKSIPEIGFYEFETAKLIAESLAETGARIRRGLARTAVIAELGQESSNPAIILLADMDALPTPGAPGGMAHSCGHYAQCAVMIQVFIALAAAQIPEREGIRLIFVGAPAEEYVDLARRAQLKAEGQITYLSGKQELIRLGIFDRPCVVLKYHSMEDSEARELTVNGTLGGFMAKRAEFIGKPAHAGAHPEDGINALSAASLALQAIHAQRDTFKDEDRIKIHPILSEGGLVVNIVPSRAVIDTYVRGATPEAVAQAAKKVDRSFRAGALALGATLRISNTPGYQPFKPSPALGEVLGKAALEIETPEKIDFCDQSNASDDIGDVACLAPTCQLGCSGFSGTIHSKDFEPSDAERAYLRPAMILARAAQMLAADKGEAAKEIIRGFSPRSTKARYLDSLESMFSVKEYHPEEGD